MLPEQPRAGVCLVRVEVQSRGVLITVRMYADVERDTAAVRTSTTDAETAVQTVREFLLAFLAGEPES
ncbi:hypothetical protein OG453_40340 [Streptomyces sp. NBC_01381]|uniref:hypothetical protein n=1 Tax=Streptomyces sp. NBC_01381 TaxID=2903845 RepID=UPI0022562111|nr:hypothetical protein [Streptomyces sp. NBC_01381]MCX4672821.1 hypothetical protein [Streptomyces sp. NBC_01381]